MGRISLKEQYDNKDVIQQIYLLRDNFESLETETNEAIQAAKDAAATVGQYTERINRAETTATDRNTSSFHDTPDSAVNVQDVYNNGMTRQENYGTTARTSSTRDTRSDEATGTSTSNENTTDKLTESIDNITMDDPNKQVEDACRIWRDLASEFVAGFEKNFMSILWC